jgi:hypothetical protein
MPKLDPRRSRDLLVVLLATAAIGSTGCSTVCEDFEELCPEILRAERSREVECTGVEECSSRCFVDADSCEFSDELIACLDACAKEGE